MIIDKGEILAKRELIWDLMFSKYVRKLTPEEEEYREQMDNYGRNNNYDIPAARDPDVSTLPKLFRYIHLNLDSNLKKLLNLREKYFYLDNELLFKKYDNRAIAEIERLRQHISDQNILQYIYHRNLLANNKYLADVIENQQQSSLKSLLYKRRTMKDNNEDYGYVAKAINAEWKRLSHILKPEYITQYANYVLNHLHE